ncbi:hypothetical protein BaRGS_00020055 [Batillaria attramentaria]|uniref:Uncharacterized protein n=1 Tax=Batillaria attramentaria TaxID=370345 RepID=A0ABD0KPB6_9CAEN
MVGRKYKPLSRYKRRTYYEKSETENDLAIPPGIFHNSPWNRSELRKLEEHEQTKKNKRISELCILDNVTDTWTEGTENCSGQN